MSLEQALREREDALHNCVHCGFCLPACPTYARLGDEADSPRGRLHLMKAVVEGRIDADSDAFVTHIDRCLGCRACEPVCPSGVEYGLLLERARSVIREARPPRGMKKYLPDLMASLPRRPWLRFLLRGFRDSRIPALLATVLPSWQWLRPVKFGSAMLASTLPSPLPKGALGKGGTRPEPSTEWPHVRVGVLTGCIQDTLFRHVNDATVLTLEVNGYEVVPVPRQGCCGALHAHDGDLEGARKLARANVQAFEEAEVDFIATNAAGCGAAMRDYGELLEGDEMVGEAAHRFANKCRDVTELLAERGPLPGAPINMRVAYDAPCHLMHAQGVTDAPLKVLAAIPGLEVRVIRGADECCGGAGTYGITHPELGGRIGQDKIEAVLAEEPDGFVTGNPGCLMQIGGEGRVRGAQVAGRHPVEVLAESYGTVAD